MLQNPTFPTRISGPDRVAMTAAQIKRFVFRESLFQRRGMTQAQAEAWADRMHDRDCDSGDKRHTCFECKNFQARRKTCFKKQPTSIYQLANCARFEWQLP